MNVMRPVNMQQTRTSRRRACSVYARCRRKRQARQGAAASAVTLRRLRWHVSWLSNVCALNIRHASSARRVPLTPRGTAAGLVFSERDTTGALGIIIIIIRGRSRGTSPSAYRSVKCSRLTDLSTYSELPRAKLQAKLTVKSIQKCLASRTPQPSPVPSLPHRQLLD